jgi:uncharacterized protein (TIGR02266 family)
MAGPKPPPAPPGPQSERRAANRAGLAVPVRVRYDSVLDFVDTQSMNISRTGMFIVTDTPAPLGSTLQFEFSLSDGFVLLKGMAEVVRVATGGIVAGMGLRFLDMDLAYQEVIERIVAVNTDEGRISTLNFDFSRPATAMQMPAVTDQALERANRPAARAPAPPPRADLPAAPAAGSAPPPPPPAVPPVQLEGTRLRILLGRDTVHHFTANPLTNARNGGFMIPTDTDVPMGTVLAVEIADMAGQALLSGKGKVLTKQDKRIGVRLFDVPKESVTRLQEAVAKLAPPK